MINQNNPTAGFHPPQNSNGPEVSGGPVGRNFLLTTADLAQQLRIAEVTIKLSRKTGILLGVRAPQHVKIGRLVRYRSEDITEWLESLCREEWNASHGAIE